MNLSSTDSNNSYNTSSTNYSDPVRDLTNRFRLPHEEQGFLQGAATLIGGFFGTFISPFASGLAQKLSGEELHRVEITVPYEACIDGMMWRAQQILQEVTRLKSELAENPNGPEAVEIQEQLLLKKEELLEMKQDIAHRKCSVMAAMRAHFGERTDVSESDMELITDIEKLHAETLQEFESIAGSLEKVRQDMADKKVQKWMISLPFSIVEPTKERIENDFELAQHPWMRKGAMAFLQQHLDISSIDSKAVERALGALGGMFGKSAGEDLTAGDLHNMIAAMEKTLQESDDKDGKLANALVALKKLAADAVLEHPDEIRRIASLATFLFVGSMTGGIDGMITASFAKALVDRVLSNLLPKPDANKPPSMLSNVLRVVEAGAVIASGNVVGAGAYVAAELAHNYIPEEVKPALVFGAACLAAGPVVGAGIALAIENPHVVAAGAAKIPSAISLLRNPKEIPAAAMKKLGDYMGKIKLAAKEGRWKDVILRISVLVLPVILTLALLSYLAIPLAAGTATSFLITAALGAATLATAAAFLLFLGKSEKRKKEEMVRVLEGWQEDYMEKFPDVETRDQGVVKVFDDLKEKAKAGETVDRETFLQLLKDNVPSLKDYSIEELEAAMNRVQEEAQVEVAA
ncbi:MAG: hypothetical protein Q8K75_01205 [Chlamydiales bacterium]|nr:hypothetical protein [Chlamydiales bacterium]